MDCADDDTGTEITCITVYADVAAFHENKTTAEGGVVAPELTLKSLENEFETPNARFGAARADIAIVEPLAVMETDAGQSVYELLTVADFAIAFRSADVDQVDPLKTLVW